MVDIQSVSIVIASLSLSVAAIYYILTLRNTYKTRQASLFTSIQNRMDSPDFWLSYRKVVYDLPGKSPEERTELFRENDFALYGDFMSLISFYEHIGWLVRQGLLDVDAIMSLPSTAVNVHRVVTPILEEFEKRTGRGQRYRDFNYLVEKIEEIRKIRGFTGPLVSEKIDEDVLPKSVRT